MKGGPADTAGIQADDIVLAVNKRPVSSPRQLALSVYREGDSHVTLTIQRGEQRLDLFAKPQERPDALDALADATDPSKNVVAGLGIIGVDISPKIAEMMPDLRRPAGVLVVASTAARPFEAGGLQAGDAIFSVNRKVVNSISELRAVVTGMKSGDAAVLLAQRDQNLIYVPLNIE